MNNKLRNFMPSSRTILIFAIVVVIIASIIIALIWIAKINIPGFALAALRDQTWQLIGVIVSTVVTIVSLFSTADQARIYQKKKKKKKKKRKI